MKTNNFWHYPSGSNRIVISRAVPRGIEAGYRRYPKLAPGSWFKNPEYKNDQAAYRERYIAEILAPLDPEEVWEQLHQLAGDEEPILLCWEPLKKPSEWCHRRMVAEWFEKALGVTVPEYVPAEQNTSQLELL
jgi:uncharacterized protein YeaO (DUF488 family)